MKRSSGVIRYILLAVAAFGALEWALSYRIAAVLSATGWLLMIAVVSTFIVAALTKWRPTAGLIRFCSAASVVSIVIWLASGIVDLSVHPTASEEWHFGSGRLSYTRYSTRSPQFPNAPDYDLRLEPAVYPFPVWLLPLPSAYIALGHGSGGSSRTVAVGTWPLAACIAIPAFVLSQLRRTRLPFNACRNCDYNLTGNITGVCPECGETTAS